MSKMNMRQFRDHLLDLGFDSHDVRDISHEVETYGEIKINDDLYIMDGSTIRLVNNAVLVAFESMLDELPDNVLPLTPFFIKL